MLRPWNGRWTWARRVLLTIALSVGAWVLFGVTSGAHAHSYASPRCEVLPTAQSPNTCGAAQAADVANAPDPDLVAGLSEPVPAETSGPVPTDTSEPAPAETSEPVPADLAEPVPADVPEPGPAPLPEPEAADPPESDPAAPSTPPVPSAPPPSSEPEEDSPPAVPVDDPSPEDPREDGDEGPAETPDGTVPPSTPDGTGTTVDSSPTDPATAGVDALPGVPDPLVDPLLVGPLPVDPLLVDPLLVDPLLVGLLLVDPAAVVDTALPVDPATVIPASIGVVAATDPCSGPDLGPVAAADIGAAWVGDARRDRQPRTLASSATTGSPPAPRSAEGGGAPLTPPSPPTPVPPPVHLPTPIPTPVPAGPAGAPGTSAAGFSGTSCYGAGQTDDADSIDAVLFARITASLAQAAQRPTSGFAGSVIGGTRDPGVRPG